MTTLKEVKPRPFLKWAGGKHRAAAQIVAKLPDRIGTYYEPFVGGGAVFFTLAAQGRFDRAVIGDGCPELMNAYHVVRDDVDELVRTLSSSSYRYDRQTYLAIRALQPEALRPVDRAARMIYLNKTGFNGLYRVNSKGQFNTPFGKYNNPVICDEVNLRACSAALQGVDLVEGDFEDSCTDIGAGDAVYFDPPYIPTSDTSKFTNYTSLGFGEEDQRRLAAFFASLRERGACAVLTNSTAADRGAVRGIRL
jgi:DNA adenine methylase